VSEYIAPNELAHVHRQLNLRSSAWVLPVSTEHGNFLESLLIAQSLVQSERAQNVLIVCGGNWTRYVNYQCMESFGASDGAGAVVYGLTDDESRFELIDAITYQCTDLYSLMCMHSWHLYKTGFPYRSSTCKIGI
jgi:3-oxoacyl-[acyl-carrier-protein] synthase III